MRNQIKEIVLHELHQYTVGEKREDIFIESEDLDFISEAIATRVEGEVYGNPR